MKTHYKLISALVLISLTASAEAGYTLKNGRIVDTTQTATMCAQDHFAVGLQALEVQDWEIAAMQFNLVSSNFPGTEEAKQAYYYLGVADFYLEEYDSANTSFSYYLMVHSSPEFFQETVNYKFAIANLLAEGKKRRCFGKKQLPKWACGKQLAIQIYDEVIAAVPCSPIAAQALVSKGCLLWQMKDYRSAVEAFNLVIRRFPKDERAADCYTLISKVYLEQSQQEYQNPDILALAEINLRKFSRDFPREERLCQVEEDLNAIKETNAQGLYETGQFYERCCKRCAAIIYYRLAMQQFPDTCVADNCRQRLLCLDPAFVTYIDSLRQTPGAEYSEDSVGEPVIYNIASDDENNS